MYTNHMDKVKINLGYLSYEKLSYDAETFGFFHDDGSMNLNAFLNVVIANMYDFRKDNLTQRRNFLQGRLSNRYNHVQIDQLVSSLSSFDSLSRHISEESKDVYVSIRPNKETQLLFETIALTECKETSFSSYLFSLLEEYLHLDQSEREIIANKKEYELVNKAIEDNLFIAFTNGIDRKVILRPFLFGSNRDNSFNYVYGVLGEQGKELCSVHLFKLRNNLVLIDKHFSFTKDEKDYMNKNLITQGIQFIGSSFIKATVELDKLGLKRLKKIYYNRPLIESITPNEKTGGGTVVLAGSEYQIQSYLYRLEDHAFVLNPLSMSQKLCESHRLAYLEYSKKLAKQIKK